MTSYTHARTHLISFDLEQHFGLLDGSHDGLVDDVTEVEVSDDLPDALVLVLDLRDFVLFLGEDVVELLVERLFNAMYGVLFETEAEHRGIND